MKKTFEIALDEKELKKRTSKTYLVPKKMLKKDSKEYKKLKIGDKKALKHLIKAAIILDEVYLKQDNPNNIEFREFLKEEIKKGNKKAKMAFKLFQAQRGIIAVDTESNKIILAKGEKESAGKGFYPNDLGVNEFHEILIQMLKDCKIKEVKEILNQRSMIVRDKKELKALDYTNAFEKEFKEAAQELEEAAKYSTNKVFNEYLILQAKALKENNPMLDAQADKKWASLQNTPLEFTISREQYSDEMTGSVVENKELKALLKKHKIEPLSKDSIGTRVGIVNKKGTKTLLEIEKYIPLLAKNMPFYKEYNQKIKQTKKQECIYPQTMVDVDIVTLSGDERAFRGGMTLAQNLPNNDKLSLTIGGGRRNVYHRQVRQISDYKKLQKRLDAILDKKLHKFYDKEADHWFTIGHENAHSLGPKEGTEALGKYKNIIEENKADMASLAMLDILTREGMYSEFQKKQILVSFMADNFLKAKPTLSQAHRVRSVMQTKYFLENKAIKVDDKGILHIDLEKMIPTAQKMLKDIIRIQLDGDFKKGESYVLKHFVWTDEMERVAKKLKKIDKTLNGIVLTPLADRIVKNI